jgi:hypothetical protein
VEHRWRAGGGNGWAESAGRESQGDCGLQPKVARDELPWGTHPASGAALNGLRPRLANVKPAPSRTGCKTPRIRRHARVGGPANATWAQSSAHYRLAKSAGTGAPPARGNAGPAKGTRHILRAGGHNPAARVLQPQQVSLESAVGPPRTEGEK